MLEFKVEKQKLTRLDVVEPATDSEQYLKAKFTINDADWNGKAKTAYFRLGDKVYKALLNSNNECIVPSEVLIRSESRYAKTQGSKIFVSLVGEYGTVRITTNELQIDLNSSGYSDALTPEKPTENEYQQILTQYANNEAAINEAKAECETARADLVGVKNIFANAIKGKLSGAVVRADDVSPVEHNPKIWVHGKNLLNIPDTVVEGDYAWCNTQIGSFELAAGTYTLSVDFLQSGTDKSKISISARNYNAVTSEYASNGSTEVSGRLRTTFTIPEGENGFTLFAYSNVLGNALNTKCTFSNFQIEKGGVATEYTPYIDATNIEVTRCGKSVFSKSSQVVTGNAKPWASLLVAAVKVPAGDYVAHCRFTQTGQDKTTISMSVRSYNDYSVPFGDTSSSAQSGLLEKKFTVTEGSGGFQIFLYSNTLNEPLTTECYFENICVEVGTEATGYSVYNGTKHTPSADGTVEGITSLSPNMTILTDTEGAIVECEYIKDTNKVLQKIADALNITI